LVLSEIDWLKVCSSMGDGLSHSIEDKDEEELIQLRELMKPSIMIQTKKITERNDTKEPNDDTIFQVMKASG